jgi:drug/metabolite transporter (DMT)-like permease
MQQLLDSESAASVSSDSVVGTANETAGSSRYGRARPGPGRHGTGHQDQVSGALPALLAGCLLVGASSTFIKLSGASADTAAFLRCALALIGFIPVSVWEWRKHGPPPVRMIVLELAAGLFLGWDYTMWTQSILDSGAGVATVLIGIQVVAFPLLARLVLGERVQRRFLIALPVMIIGLALTGGVAGADPQAPHPVRGAVLGISAGIAYAGYLFLNRQGAAHDRRLIVTPVGFGTASAAAVIGSVGLLRGDISLHLSAHAWFWLAALALGGQLLSYVLIGYATLRLPSGKASAVLLLQPTAAVALGTLILGERPDITQYAGMLITVAAVATATIQLRRRPIGPRS